MNNALELIKQPFGLWCSGCAREHSDFCNECVSSIVEIGTPGFSRIPIHHPKHFVPKEPGATSTEHMLANYTEEEIKNAIDYLIEKGDIEVVRTDDKGCRYIRWAEGVK